MALVNYVHEELSVESLEYEVNLLPFSIKELNEYLLEYEKVNYPMVSHSLTYKENYHPSYRVIKKDFLLTMKT